MSISSTLVRRINGRPTAAGPNKETDDTADGVGCSTESLFLRDFRRRSTGNVTAGLPDIRQRDFRTMPHRGNQRVTAGQLSASLPGGVLMEDTRYGLKISLRVPYEEAIVLATDALKAQGFGVLTTIDVKQTLKAKLDRDFQKYVILGACNPSLADRALHAELEVGLLLPCNVIVYETGPSSSVVAAMAPVAALGIVGENSALAQVAREADRLLRQALASLESPVAT